MNLYKISQDVNNDYDTFDAVVVAASDEESARAIHPDKTYGKDSWVTPKKVKVELIGVAAKGTPQGVILASFNAG